MLFTEVLEEYMYFCMEKGFTEKTMANKRLELGHFKRFILEKRAVTELESISIHDLKAYMRFKQQQGLKPQSIVTLIKVVKAFFSWCEKEEYLEENIAKKLTTPNVPKTVLKGFKEDEVKRMINAFTLKTYFEIRNKAIIAMLADTGIRSMEIRGLEVGDIRDTTILVHGKGNKERFVYVSPALKRILIKYERMKREYFKDKITTNHYFLSYKGSYLSNVGLQNIIIEAGKRAKVEGKRCSPHTFRHFFAVQSLTRGNIDIYSLSRLLGHSDITITQRYLQTLQDEQLLEKAVASSPLMNFKK